MAATMVSAGPAWANNTGSFTNQQGLFSVGDDGYYWDDSHYWDDGYWWDDGVSFSIGDVENESGDIYFS
jgi:hypothetical protein